MTTTEPEAPAPTPMTSTLTPEERLAAARAFAYALYLASCRADYRFDLHIENPYLLEGEDGSALYLDEEERFAEPEEPECTCDSLDYPCDLHDTTYNPSCEGSK